MGQKYFFSLPFSGIKNGEHVYHFHISKDFFNAIEDSLITDGEFDIKLELDRRSSICDLKFFINGRIPVICDRCVADIALPVEAKYDMVLKVTPKDIEDTEEVIYIKDTENTLILDQIVYELICVSLPMVNVYDCENDNPIPCNVIVKNKIKEQSNDVTDSIWSQLKDLKSKK